MSSNYVPELGQAFFGNPARQFQVPEYVEAAIRHIEDTRWRVEHNLQQESTLSPTENTGARYEYSLFSIRAYYWGDDPERQALPNFKWRDLEICWYKYLGRGMSMNRHTTPQEIADMIDECLYCLRLKEWEETEEDERKIFCPVKPVNPVAQTPERI